MYDEEKQTPILFSLEQCIKCQQTKDLFSENTPIKTITFPHDYSDWSDSEKKVAKQYGVFEELQRTAPILWVDGTRIVGYLRIRKWFQDNQMI